MNVLNLVNALPGALAQGLIWGIMAIGVYITFRILDIADLTVDGSMCTGGAVCIMLLQNGQNVWVAMTLALLSAIDTTAIGIAGRAGASCADLPDEPYAGRNSAAV